MGTLVEVIRSLFSLYWYLLLASAVLGFLPDLRETKIGSLLTRITEPYLYIFRRYIPPLSIGQIAIDLSWIVGVAVFAFIEGAVSNVLFRLLAGIS